MNDLISRQAVIEAISEAVCDYDDGIEWESGVVSGLEGAMELIEKLPSAEPKRGKWAILGDMCSVKGYWATCSVCGHTSFGGGKFCRECGAKMGVTE